MMHTRLVAAAMVAVFTFWPAVAQACAVCTDPNDEARTAFIFTTALMTALPLLFVGGGVWWLRRRLAELDTGASPSS